MEISIDSKLKLTMKILLTLFLILAVGGTSLVAQIQKSTNIQITIQGVPPAEAARINAPYPVDANGNIRMWEIGTIRAAGLSPTALSKKIEDAYKQAQIYTTPTIQIETGTNDTIQKMVTVTGAVGRPGSIPFIRGMTLTSALATAGGPNTFGTTKRVTVWREGKKYLLSPLVNEKHKLELVYPDDVIEVDQVKPWESGGK